MTTLIHFFSTIRARILAAFSGLFVVTLGLVAAVLMYGLPIGEFRGYFQDALTGEMQHLDVVADSKKNYFNNWYRERRGDLQVFSYQVRDQKFLSGRHSAQDVARLSEFFGEIRNAYPAYEALALFEPAGGRAYAISGEDDGLAELARRPDFASPGNEEFLAMLAGGEHGQPRLVMGRQVLSADGNRIEGLLLARIHTESLLTNLLAGGQGERVGSSEETFLVNRDQALLAEHKASALGARPTRRDSSPAAALAASGNEGAALSVDYRGVEVLAAYRHIRLAPDVGWGLVVKRDRAEVLAPLHRSLRYFALVAGAGLAFLLLAALVISAAISRPISTLAETARRIERGDFSARAAVGGDGEVARLAETFNVMVDRIEGWHEEMEQALAARTLELAQEKNTALRYLNIVGVILVSLDREGRVTLINRKGCELLGYADNEILGKHWFVHFLPESARAAAEAFFAQMMAGEAEAAEYAENPVLTRSGEERVVAWHNIVLRDEADNIVGVLSSGEDVTRRREMERDLRQLNETLEQRVAAEVEINRAKDHLLIQQSRLAAMGEMIGNIAHQWRQPLNALGLVIANIKDEYDYGEQTPESLEAASLTARRLIDHMSATIDDFRNFFRPNREQAPFSIRDAVQSAFNMTEASIKNNHIRLSVQDGDPTLRVNGHANEFSQVLVNLVGNAKEAIVERKIADGNIAIRFGREGLQAWLSVTDNGGGIPAEAMPRIFDPYFTTKEKGTGIGLYMSRMIMENMGGKIEAHNTADGARIVLRLPLAEIARNG